MLDQEFHISKDAKAALVSIVCPKFEEHSSLEQTNRSLIELRELLRTLNIETGPEFIQNKKTVEPATILGSGKLEEIGEACKAQDVSLLVFDFELSSGQVRNIKKLTGLSVVDRCHVILEIFSEHARTREARIQIEISKLQYMLPRLAGFWSHLGRQKGGIGMKGEGEQQIELDRRIIRSRIEFHKKDLEEVRKSREQQKKKRKDQAITAALVGYTNAGKSSIMNRLCKADVLEENKLFATLDSTFRMLTPDTKPPMILIDTVGFISNLPNTLIDGFKTTLESAMEADLLLIICDISDPYYENQLKVTQEVLKDLGVDKKDQFIVFNKKDRLDDKVAQAIIKRAHPQSFLVSANNAEDMENLREYVINFFLSKQNTYDLFIPYSDGDAISQIMSKTNVVNTVNHEKGIYYQVKAPDFIFKPLGLNSFLIGGPLLL